MLHVKGAFNAFDALTFYDLSGRKVFKAGMVNAGNDFSITLPNDMAKGCYIVKLTRNGSVVKYEKLFVK